MRVVFITFFRDSKGGGIGRVSYEIAQAFAQQDHKTVLICPGEKTQLRKVTPHLKYLQIRSIGEGDVAIPYLTVPNLKFLFNFLEKFSPQIVHGHDFGPLTLATQFWAINHKIPFIYTTHVLLTKPADFAINEFSKSLKHLMDTTLMKKYFFSFFKNCDAFIAPNKDAQKDILKYGFREKVFTIPNGRYIDTYQRCYPAKLSEKQKQLTFIGYLSKRKNQKYLFWVMECLPENFVLNLIGAPINPKYLQELKAFVQKKGLKNVNFLGEVPYEKIAGLLEKTHVFVSASKMEVQSLVIIEALASGTPVVGLSNETVNEFIDDSVGFCLEEKTSPRTFAEKVKKICSLSQKEYEFLCHNARKKVAHLDWPDIVKQTEMVYQKLIKEKKINRGEKKMSNIKEILKMLPPPKFKSFLQKKVQKSGGKISKKKSILMFIMTIIGTFFIGTGYWLLSKTKRIPISR
ncbi:MAG: glycosyltransferase [Actinobacteria bacterium]|nr:glycosyltransferase [Actinomycetota bacterium]